MGVYSRVKRIAYKLTFVVLLFFILLWCSIFLYGLTYYLYIPAVAHVCPVHLEYDTRCSGSVCRFPSANVSLAMSGYNQLLARGQAYAVEISLDMPESEPNMKQGMFMVKLDMLSENGEILRTSYRPAVLHYKSPLFRTIYTIFFAPALLAGTFEEKQILIVSLFENYIENSYRPTYFIHVEIQAHYVEIYSANVRIHAQFKGLRVHYTTSRLFFNAYKLRDRKFFERFFMYYWPILSCFIGVSSNFFLLCIITLVTVIRLLMTNSRVLHISQAMFSQSQEVFPSKLRSPRRCVAESSENIELSEQVSLGSVTLPVQQGAGTELPSRNAWEQRIGVETLFASDDSVFQDKDQGFDPEESDLVKSIRRRNVVDS